VQNVGGKRCRASQIACHDRCNGDSAAKNIPRWLQHGQAQRSQDATSMNLNLDRPLVFLDFETTGLDTEKDRIIELAFVKQLPDGTRSTLVQRTNPGIEVSKGATKVTGIHTLDACGLFWGPPLKKVGQKLVDFLDGCDLAGFNQIAFDVPMWVAECKRHSIPFSMTGRQQVDVRVLFNIKEPTWDRFLQGPRNLGAAVRHYCGRELKNAHSAEADCLATADVLHSILQRYPDLPGNVPSLHEICARHRSPSRDEETREGQA
jgi:DNA polymerase-3 subunit epsilon